MNYELSYGCIGINEYLVGLAGRGGKVHKDERAAMGAAFDLISAQEEVVCRRLLDFLNAVPSVKIIGEKTADARLRVPTVSFTVKNLNSAKIVSAIDQYNIGIRYGDFYARRLAEHIDLEKDGVVRVSMVHYNTTEEIDRLVERLAPLLS